VKRGEKFIGDNGEKILKQQKYGRIYKPRAAAALA